MTDDLRLPPLPYKLYSFIAGTGLEREVYQYAIAAIKADPQQRFETGSALRMFYECGGQEEHDPIERLRFYCSNAMTGQDWLDVEPFFDDVIADRQQRGEPVANCWSNNEGDSWGEHPADGEFVEGLKVGDEYELQASVWWWTERFRVIKAPDDTSDDYEVEPVSIRTAPQPAAPAQEPSDDKGWKLGNLLTLNQDGYPALGSWFVQIWEGDSVVASVYGESRDELLSRANTLLARYGSAQPSVPEGWKLVPVEPTETQQWVVSQFFSYEDTAEVVYKNMLAAAPKFGEEE